eukprot:1394507-Amorphochlora_amoeboformis.AAC.1
MVFNFHSGRVLVLTVTWRDVMLCHAYHGYYRVLPDEIIYWNLRISGDHRRRPVHSTKMMSMHAIDIYPSSCREGGGRDRGSFQTDETIRLQTEIKLFYV